MQPQEDPDRTIVERAQAGDDAAFNELMVRYQQPVLHFAYRVLSGAAEAEDVAQETFVRAYFHLRKFTFRPGALFSTWLFQIANNAALDHLRKQKRHPHEPLPSAHEELASSQPNGSTEAARRELGDAIASAFARLPTDQRTALVLAEYHGQSAAEIAVVMKCSTRSVESRLYRARRQLREWLAPWRDK